jgi:hypothetical protein
MEGSIPMRFFTRSIVALAALATTVASTPSAAEIGIGADVVSRYIFRGTDFGNAVTVQPGIAYATDAFEVGAWSSWSIDGGGANENDLYATVNLGPVGVTITDYFFPAAAPADFFSFSDGDAVHILEAAASADVGVASLLAAFNFSGDAEDSFWLQASMPLAALSRNDVEVGVTLGAGNGLYTTDTDPALVQVSLDVSSGDYFAQYILNPEAEITFLVFGTSF